MDLQSKHMDMHPQILRPIFRMGTTNQVAAEAIKLRPSNLTLSRYDERMPMSPLGLPLSKSCCSQNSNHRGSHPFFDGSRVFLRRLPSPHLLEVDNKSFVVPPKKLSAIFPSPGSETSLNPTDLPDTDVEEVSFCDSVFLEIARRRRLLAITIGVICFIVFLTGCVITAACYSLPQTELIPGHIAGPLLTLSGGAAVVATVCHLNWAKFPMDKPKDDFLFGNFEGASKALQKNLLANSAERLISNVVASEANESYFGK